MLDKINYSIKMEVIRYSSIDDIAVEADTPKDPDKRDTVKKLGIVALVSAIGGAGVLYKVADSLAQDYQMPSDKIILQYMNQPVEETLKETNVRYVNDSNYKKEVFGSDKPVMVLFYTDLKSAEGINPSRGLTALTKVLNKKFPEVKLCAYKLAEALMTPKHVLETIGKKYPLKDTPAILFYDNDKGDMELIGQLKKGITSMGTFHRLAKKYFKAIPKYMLD